MSKKKLSSAAKRRLINQHLPFEIYAYATARYYGQLQELGAIDVVEIMMHIEGLEEKEAISRCIQMLKDLQATQAEFVATMAELLDPDPLEERMKEALNNHHKKN